MPQGKIIKTDLLNELAQRWVDQVAANGITSEDRSCPGRDDLGNDTVNEERVMELITDAYKAGERVGSKKAANSARLECADDARTLIKLLGKNG